MLYREFFVLKRALDDWERLMDKYNSIEDKSIDNLKRVFADQSDNSPVFYEIQEGIIRAFLSSDDGIIGEIKEPFVIVIDDEYYEYVYSKDIIKKLEKYVS